MKTIRVVMLVMFLSVSGISYSLAAAPMKAAAQEQSREKLIGAWHLVSLDAPGAEGKQHLTDIKGQLIYTRDGHMSVQLMYPPPDSALTNDYVLNGYEASFGTYEVDDTVHTVTHHVQASVTRGLVGKNLTRAFQFSNGRLIIKSTSPDEHWSVTWEHD